METAAMGNSMYPFFKKEKINIHISQQKVIMQNIPLKFASLVSYKDAFINLNTVKANCFKIQNRFFARLRNKFLRRDSSDVLNLDLRSTQVVCGLILDAERISRLHF